MTDPHGKMAWLIMNAHQYQPVQSIYFKKTSSKPRILNVWSTYPYFWSVVYGDRCIKYTSPSVNQLTIAVHACKYLSTWKCAKVSLGSMYTSIYHIPQTSKHFPRFGIWTPNKYLEHLFRRHGGCLQGYYKYEYMYIESYGYSYSCLTFFQSPIFEAGVFLQSSDIRNEYISQVVNKITI